MKKETKARVFFEIYECITSTQALNELSNIMIKKFKITPSEVSGVVDEISENCQISTVGLGTIKIALDIAERYKYSYYDSLIIPSALENDCNILLTEDMQDGQNIESTLTIKNIYIH